MNDGKKTINTGRKSTYDNEKYVGNFIQLGEVISTDDPNALGRIKVRIIGPTSKGGDDGIPNENLAWCFPLLPKHLQAPVKVKEAVFIFIFNKEREFQDRLYLGPIISQSQQLDYDPYFITALRGFSFANQTPNLSPNTVPEINGVFPNKEDVSIQGRYNTDITQKPNEVVIRAGKFMKSTPNSNNPFNFKFNAKTQAFIQIKNDVIIKPATQNEEVKYGSVINHVANKINLITLADGSPNFNVLNQDNLISDDELANILKDAHQLPFGDVLLEYLILLKNMVLNHVHNGSGKPPTDLTTSGNKQSVAEFKAKADDLEKSMLSKNIRIN
jgi:hypothetical protein